jgi:hypothetical protein
VPLSKARAGRTGRTHGTGRTRRASRPRRAGTTTVTYAIGSAAGKTLTVAVQSYR